jgi:Pyridoxamine 5'-phosphate oxidase
VTERAPSETTNLDRYGNGPLPWSRARDLLVAGPPQPETTFFLATTRPDGRPHVAGVGVHWHDGDLYFTSGPATRKAKDLAERPACTISISLDGLDLVLDGEATRVDDPDLVATVIETFRAGGWPAEIDGALIVGPYSAPSAGPPPWHLYRFTIHTAVGVASAEPNGATRWRFG